MKIKLLILTILMACLPRVSAQDSVFTKGIQKVSFTLSNSVVEYFVGCTEKKASANSTTTTTIVPNVGKILIRQNGTGSFQPNNANYSGVWTYYTKIGCDDKIKKTIYIGPKPAPQQQFSYTWKGSIGNTSASDYGAGKIKGLRSFTSISELGNYLYFTTGYPEGNSPIFKSLKSSPNIKIEVPPKTNEDKVLEGTWGVSDGTKFYMVGFDPYGYVANGGTGYTSKIDCAIVAYDASDNEVLFQYGESTSCSLQDNPYKSLIAIVRNDSTQRPVRLEVDNNYLYVFTRTQKKTYNKITGQYVGAQAYTHTYLSTYTRNGITINMNLTDVRYNGTILCRAQTSPVVNYYTYTPRDFNFHYINKGFVYIAVDGSYWVGDAGNSRALHYTSSGTYIEQVAFIPMNYSCSVDRNATNRLFAGFLEYNISYPSLTWELVANWSYNLHPTYRAQDPINTNIKNALRDVITINGVTYAMLDSVAPPDGFSYPCKMKFTSTGLKRVKVFDAFANVFLNTNGDEYVLSFNELLGGQNILYKNNVEVQRTPIITETSASYGNNGGFAITSDSFLITYNNQKHHTTNYHLQWIKNNQIVYSRAMSKYSPFVYPTGDTFAIYDGSGDPASYSVSVCNDIAVWMYTGEFYQGAQVTKLYIYKKGQYVTTIGKTYAQAVAIWGLETPKEIAGNAKAGDLVYNNGTYYYFFNDEHGGALQCFILNGL